MDINKLSSYQNPEGKLKDRLVPRVESRLGKIDWNIFKGRTVLDIGCNNGLFVREAIKHGATRAVGVDISDCIQGAKELGDGEFWQMNVNSKEFRKFCPRFDIVVLFSVLTHIGRNGDIDEFLDWLDDRVKYVLFFESNHGERYKKHIDLVRKHIYFEKCVYLGPSDIPEKPHYMWVCKKADHEMKYPQITSAPVTFLPINDIVGVDEKTILSQKITYPVTSDKFKDLVSDIKDRGIREPIVVRARKDGKFNMFQGGHRYLAAKQLGYKYVPCKVI